MTTPRVVRLADLPPAGRAIVLALIGAKKAADMKKGATAIEQPAAPAEVHRGVGERPPPR